jgi:hypothetical protein
VNATSNSLRWRKSFCAAIENCLDIEGQTIRFTASLAWPLTHPQATFQTLRTWSRRRQGALPGQSEGRNCLRQLRRLPVGLPGRCAAPRRRSSRSKAGVIGAVQMTVRSVHGLGCKAVSKSGGRCRRTPRHFQGAKHHQRSAQRANTLSSRLTRSGHDEGRLILKVSPRELWLRHMLINHVRPSNQVATGRINGAPNVATARQYIWLAASNGGPPQ